jgi:TolB-like protein
MLPALALALALAADDPAPPAAATPAVTVDEGAIADAAEAVLAGATEVVRIAVPPIVDGSEARGRAVELALVRALNDRRREEIVTPAFVRAKLKAQGEARLNDVPIEKLKSFAADHVLLGAVVDEGGKAVLHLKLIHVETGALRGESSAVVSDGSQTTAQAADVRAATDVLVEEIASVVEEQGVDVHTHRIAVSRLNAQGAALESRLDVFVQSELIRALRRRGFLVVERDQLAAATDQLALGQVLEESGAPQVGKMLGAQSLVVGNVAEAGATFLVTVRVVSSETGAVLGAASAPMPRDDVVTMADVETRTPVEAAMRSAVAPGWGQAYNGQGVKSVVFGVVTYASLAATLGLGVGAIAAEYHYNDVGAFKDLPVDERGPAVEDARYLVNVLRLSTAVAGAVTVTAWTIGIADALLESDSPSSGGGGS